MIGALPESLIVGGVEYPIRSDYRTILQIFEMFDDRDLQGMEPWIIATYLLFEDFSCADDVFRAIDDGLDMDEVAKQIKWFISADNQSKKNLEKPVYSWTKDEQMIFSAINKVAGKEVRDLDYLHWWTFLGYFREIGEGNFSFVAGIRDKLNNRKKLDKHEMEFLAKNRDMVEMKPPLTKEEQEKEDEYQALIDEVLG